ncbi:UNVERIFIED_CONTAM: putative sarcosine oxidase [Sesamum angustifolium]|uniref:Sarcosine oxidase n=1 Tax=Sesamum angustifolium TaxID=2727405 RepID=A0AAW2MQY5_9LAMI
MFQTLGVQNDAVLKDNKEVIDIKKDKSTSEIVVIITRADEKFRAKKCVITVGAWTRKLIKTVRGITLPIQPVEIAAHYWKINKGHEDKFTIDNDFPTFGSHGDPPIYDTPSLEFPGLIKIHIDDGGACDPEERTWANPPDILDLLRECIRERFGGLVDSNGPVITQSCMYSMTPDKDYVIDFLRGEFGKEAVVIGGFSGHGFKMALVVGRSWWRVGQRRASIRRTLGYPGLRRTLEETVSLDDEGC